ncbi:hypothetical protein V6N13_051267 [Hibiscus sabdariffa]
MAAKQMEEIQRKLSTLKYPRANAPAQSLLFAGMERYALLEWLFFRLLGDKSPFSQQNLQGDAVDRDEETSRIQYLAEIAKFLGITTTIDTEVIQGRGSYEDRTEMLHLIVDLVEASICADNPEWSVDEQVVKDIQLIDAIAEKQDLIFSEECKLFPADVQIQSIYPLPDVSELESKLSEQTKILLNLQQKVDDLASKHAYNPDEEYTEVESKLRAHLESFLETARSFNMIYTKEIRPWTHMMEVPQLHGFGPAANRLLEAYKMLLKVSQCQLYHRPNSCTVYEMKIFRHFNKLSYVNNSNVCLLIEHLPSFPWYTAIMGIHILVARVCLDVQELGRRYYED